MRYCLRTRVICFAALSLLFVFGCNSEGSRKRPQLAKVKGTITYNGKPVRSAAVNFMMEGSPRAASGVTDDNGNFQLTTFDTNDGAPIGTHKVTVTQINLQTAVNMTPLELATKGPPPPPKNGLIPAKYLEMKTSPLQFTVEPGQNQKEIVLED